MVLKSQTQTKNPMLVYFILLCLSWLRCFGGFCFAEKAPMLSAGVSTDLAHLGPTSPGWRTSQKGYQDNYPDAGTGISEWKSTGKIRKLRLGAFRKKGGQHRGVGSWAEPCESFHGGRAEQWVVALSPLVWSWEGFRRWQHLLGSKKIIKIKVGENGGDLVHTRARLFLCWRML